MALQRVWIGLLGVTCLSWAWPCAATEPNETIDFGRDIRPILADACFTCHGPDENQREAGLRLDDPESALGEADSGAQAIVPGDLESSELYLRVSTDDESMRMPPADSDRTLSPEQIDMLRRWIEQGAVWDRHWAFVPPVRPPVPQVQHADWPRNDLDRFILARVEQEQLEPAPETDRITLLRRVAFDLTGLPPTAQDLQDFLRDDEPAAYERAVDRLLASHHYGEHMARFWLDAARYGDTHGLHLDNYREMWPYRDWVVRAFNRNLPFDQFVIEQLAGDLLADPTDDQIIATGFNRCHVSTNEGGSIADEVYVRNVVDRVVTTGTVFMGLTLECTRCHDHKYDPLTMNDFYSLFGYFNSLDGDAMDGNRKDPAPVLRVPTPQQRSALAGLDDEIQSKEQQLRAPWPELDEQQKLWELAELTKLKESTEGESATIRLGQWQLVGPFPDVRRYLFSRKHGPEGKPIDPQATFSAADGTTLAWTPRPNWNDGEIHTDLAGDMAANFIYRRIQSPGERIVKASIGSDDAIKVFLNGEQILAEDVTRSVAADQNQITLRLKEGSNDLLLKIMNFGGQTGFYFKADVDSAALPTEVVEALQCSPEDRSVEDQLALTEFFRFKVLDSSVFDQLVVDLERARKERAEIERGVATTLVWKEKPEPVPAYILKRGEYDQKLAERPRTVPAVLPPLPTDLPNDRLGLARWLVNGDHPLTARVAVNRFWLQVFGTGLVKTAEDFGTRGDRPSHPELLDWLAVQFVEDGWDIKATMKRLVMSSTYRQSSQISPEKLRLDPANRLLARGPRFRLDAEMLRDQALSVSGLLVDRLGGPSVKPPQPDGLWFAVGYSGSNTVRFAADEGPEKVHRRTLYTFIKRTSPPPQMSILDGPSRESCVMRRERTNTPLQALMLFNDPQYVQAARALALRAIQEADDSDVARACLMFEACTCRQPTENELSDLIAGVNTDRDYYLADREAAKQLVANDLISENDAPDVAAWTMAASLLLNLDEVLMKN